MKRGRLVKCPTGISGFDALTGGGLPRGRPTLICGGPGCGKTLFAVEFLVRGVRDHGEPGVLVSFEESAEDLRTNALSLGFDLRALETKGSLVLDAIDFTAPTTVTGDFTLEGLLVRLDHAVRQARAKRVVLDTIETLFSALGSPTTLRRELRRLFTWLKSRGLTTVVTAERGEQSLTRHGIEEYVSDCVIAVDHRPVDQVSTRRVRVVKYRGSTHGTNEYPFLITDRGLSVAPITSLSLGHQVTRRRLSTGVPRLDVMLGGRGYYRGSTVLVSGTAGTGKTSLAGLLARATCSRGERALYVSMEESPAQLTRNLRSIGVDLGPHLASGKLAMVASRPATHGLERHLVELHTAVERHRPTVVVLDPISSLDDAGDAALMLTRLIDFLKATGITALFTTLTAGGDALESSRLGISSLVDTWLMLETVRQGGERNRVLSIIKSRGMAHSNQASEYRLGDDGFSLLDPYLGPGGVLTGAARENQEAIDRRRAVELERELARLRAEREHLLTKYQLQLRNTQEEHSARVDQLDQVMRSLEATRTLTNTERRAMARMRGRARARPTPNEAR